MKQKGLLEAVMQNWLTAADALMETIVFYLLSPVETQNYNMVNHYTWG
jgi:hypothetical protein